MAHFHLWFNGDGHPEIWSDQPQEMRSSGGRYKLTDHHHQPERSVHRRHAEANTGVNTDRNISQSERPAATTWNCNSNRIATPWQQALSIKINAFINVITYRIFIL